MELGHYAHRRLSVGLLHNGQVAIVGGWSTDSKVLVILPIRGDIEIRELSSSNSFQPLAISKEIAVLQSASRASKFIEVLREWDMLPLLKTYLETYIEEYEDEPQPTEPLKAIVSGDGVVVMDNNKLKTYVLGLVMYWLDEVVWVAVTHYIKDNTVHRVTSPYTLKVSPNENFYPISKEEKLAVLSRLRGPEGSAIRKLLRGAEFLDILNLRG